MTPEQSQAILDAHIARMRARAAASEAVRAAGLTYNQAYEKGWRASNRPDHDLDSAEARFRRRYGDAQWDAWLDGWMDVACGREKWHLRDCPNHDECP